MVDTQGSGLSASQPSQGGLRYSSPQWCHHVLRLTVCGPIIFTCQGCLDGVKATITRLGILTSEKGSLEDALCPKAMTDGVLAHR